MALRDQTHLRVVLYEGAGAEPLEVGEGILDGEQSHSRTLCHCAPRKSDLGVKKNPQRRDLALCAEDMIQQMGRTFRHNRNLRATKKLVKLLSLCQKNSSALDLLVAFAFYFPLYFQPLDGELEES